MPYAATVEFETYGLAKTRFETVKTQCLPHLHWQLYLVKEFAVSKAVAALPRPPHASFGRTENRQNVRCTEQSERQGEQRYHKNHPGPKV